MTNHSIINKPSLLFTLFVSLIAGFVVAGIVMAWTNPTANPPSGGGALYYYNGNVGIGTTAPSSKLHVLGDDVFLNIQSVTPAVETTIFSGSSGGVNRSTIFTTGSMLSLGAGGGTRMSVLSNGNVGIGTTAPGVALDVNGNIRSHGGNWQSFTGSAYVAAYYDALTHRFDISGSPKMSIDTSGNVGIGTTGPGAKLEVSGDTKITGNLYGGGSNYVCLRTTNCAWTGDFSCGGSMACPTGQVLAGFRDGTSCGVYDAGYCCNLVLSSTCP